jgi:alkylation response protein AidB-like acyl-CoA dehydrogenase
MDFNLNKEQELLRDGLGKFLATRYDLEKSRTAAKIGPGWQPEIWRGLADDLGILGAAFPESVGGIGGGPVEIMVIAEELGRALAIEPFIDTVVVAGGLLQRCDHPGAAALLEHIADGSAIVALAGTEPDTGDHAVSTSAVRDGDQWVITGDKIAATTAPLATHLLITARTSGEPADPHGVSLFLTEFDPAAPPPGVQMHSYRTIDDRRSADLRFDGLRLPVEALLVEDAAQSLAQARDEGAAAVCAEAVGGMRKVLSDTVDYCKQRQQFGQPIGSFQVLQHRMVDMYMEL